MLPKEIIDLIQQLKNEHEVQENQLDSLIKKMESNGLTPDEDNKYLKLLFANMELERKIKLLEIRLNASEMLRKWK